MSTTVAGPLAVPEENQAGVVENPPSPTDANNPGAGARMPVTTGVTSTLQSNLVELISRALGSALEPVAKLENEYDLQVTQNLHYKDTNKQLNEMLLQAQANLAERDKLNRELRHQKNKLEEQHDRVLREKRRLDKVEEQLQTSQQQLLEERRQAGLRQDNNERQLTDNTIKINELEEETTQYKHQLNKAKLEKKELQKQHKEKDEQLKSKEQTIAELNTEVEKQKQQVQMHVDTEQQMRVREAEVVEKLNSRVTELEGNLQEKTEGFAKEKVVFHQEILDLKTQQAEAIAAKDKTTEEELSKKNDELYQIQEKLRQQADIVKSALEEKEQAITAKERAERMFGRMAEEHNVQSSELQIMTEHCSRWETQVKEKTALVDSLNKKVAAITEDLVEVRTMYAKSKDDHAEAKKELDVQADAHKEQIAKMEKMQKEEEKKLRTGHIEEMHEQARGHEAKAKELTNSLIAKQEQITKLEAELSGVKHAHGELVEDMREVQEALEKETERFAKRTAELEKSLEKQQKDRAVDKANMQKEMQALKQSAAVSDAEHEATVQAVKNKLSMVNADLHEAKTELKKMQAKVEAVQEKNQVLSDQAFEAEKSLKRLTAEHNRATEELSTVTELNATFETEVARSKNRMRMLETKLGQAQEDMNKMKQANIKLRQSVAEKQKLHDELHSTKNNEITQLIKQHNDEREQLKKLHSDLALDKNREREALQSEGEKVKTSKEIDIRRLEKDLQANQREFERVQGSYEEHVSRAELERERQEERIKELDKLLKRELEDRAADSIMFQEQVQVLKTQNEAALREEEEESSLQITSLQEQLSKIQNALKTTEEERDQLQRAHEESTKGRDRAERTLTNMSSEYQMQFAQLSQQTTQASTLETQLHSQKTELKNREVAEKQQASDLTQQSAIVDQLRSELEQDRLAHLEYLAQKESEISELQKMLQEEEDAKHAEAERAEQAEHALDRRSKAFNKELEAKQQKLRELYEVMEASAVSYQVQGKDTGDTLEDLKLPLIRESGALGESNQTEKPRRPASAKKGFAKRMQSSRSVKSSTNPGSQSARESRTR